MPISYRVDHEARVVVAAGHGVLTDADVFGYQREAWSRPDLTGYNELIDMTHVDQIALPSADRIRGLASLSAEMDSPKTRTRLAVVVTDNFAFGLGRMLQAYRELDRRSTKEIGIFRAMEEALLFLGLERLVEMPGLSAPTSAASSSPRRGTERC